MVKIIGIDILAGTSSLKASKKKKHRFAAVVMEDEEIIEKGDSISLRDLIKLCNKHEPKYLGVDNIFELQPNTNRIINFSSKLPYGTKILQVTGAPPDGFESVRRLARRNNIPYPSQHASPIETAEIICRLAEKEVGYILLPFEEETQIKISRTRSIGPGGWSQQRYSRRMRGEILRLSREVEKLLQDHDIDYDLEARKTAFGYDNAIFRAYASVAKVRKYVAPFKGELSRIIVSPIRKKRLDFIPAKGGRKQLIGSIRRKVNRGLIVGIDPGHNTGIAVLNLSGKILLVDKMKSAARGDIIRKITLYGDPTLIAADVTPPPNFVVKISKMLNASLYYPERLLSAGEKKRIVDEYTKDGEVIKGAHKRDALSAAIKAYHQYKEIFAKVNKELVEPDELPIRNRVKQLVVKDQLNIQEAILQVKEDKKTIERPEIVQPEEEELTEKEQQLMEKIDALKELSNRQNKHIENVEDHNQKLFEKNRKLRKEIGQLKRQVKKVTNERNQKLRRDRAIQTRDDELRFLRKKVKNLTAELTKVKGIISDIKRMIVMSSNKVVVPMKVVYEFSKEGIETTIERMNIEPFDVVLLVNPSGGGQNTAEMLIEREVRAVVCAKENISDQAMEAFIEADVPVLFQMPIRQIDDIAVTYHDELEQAIKDWEEQRAKIQRDKTEKQLGTIIAEYQNKRRQELAQAYKMERNRKK